MGSFPMLSPPSRIRHGSHADVMAARSRRTQRIYLALLVEAGVDYVMVGGGQIAMGDKVDMFLVAQLWDVAAMLVHSGKDLQ